MALIELTAKRVPGQSTLTLPVKRTIESANILEIETAPDNTALTRVKVKDGSRETGSVYDVYETAQQIMVLIDTTSNNKFAGDKSLGLTAGTTQTLAGATACNAYLNEASTCANANDGLKLKVATVDGVIVVINNGAAAAKIWPSTSGTIDGGTASAADVNTLAAGARRTYIGTSVLNWNTVAPR